MIEAVLLEIPDWIEKSTSKNENNSSISPWYQFKSGKQLETPEWTFDWSDLRKF